MSHFKSAQHYHFDIDMDFHNFALYYFSWLLAIGDTIMDILFKKTCKAIRRAIALW
jgi:hypothetical protein